ncbi:hypothetical protein F443_23166 [Phytophthora nicotianae P1569]|uniref:Uncharacterized protein n=1 Tax=Phytophthora nicotianae P1569 TaxID=1317065 RepID=V9DTQ3_PHYNI|nr:hypothetical protein F443_23166 [Phytophthora nicotianae P1569]
MSLNKDKTVVLPFHPWTAETEPLRQTLVDLGVMTPAFAYGNGNPVLYLAPPRTNATRPSGTTATDHPAGAVVLSQCLPYPSDWISRPVSQAHLALPLSIQVVHRST